MGCSHQEREDRNEIVALCTCPDSLTTVLQHFGNPGMPAFPPDYFLQPPIVKRIAFFLEVKFIVSWNNG